jgi:hypothetical protein
MRLGFVTEMLSKPFEKMYPHFKDRPKLIAVVKEGRQQLEQQMARERAESEERMATGEDRRPAGRPTATDAGASHS